MTTNSETKGLNDSPRLNIDVIATLLEAARDVGKYDGGIVSYRDVNEHLAKALAGAEDELARAPTSELVMGEIMTLKKLVAHFAPAPAFYEGKVVQCTDHLTMIVEELIDSLNAQHQTEDTHGDTR